jgi:hypothetical protein
MSKNIFNIGDRVKFLNDVGEGIVTQIISDKKLMVMVDGFNIPCLLSDLVSNRQPDTMPSESLAAGADEEAINSDSDGSEYVVSVAFLPPVKDKSAMYLLNDSSYQMFYTIGFVGSDGIVAQQGCGRLAPDSKVFICGIALDTITDKIDMRLDVILFKNIPYTPADSSSASLPLALNALRLITSYSANDFFDEKALIYDMISSAAEKKPCASEELPAEKDSITIEKPTLKFTPKIIGKISLPDDSRKKKEPAAATNEQISILDLRPAIMRSQAGFLPESELLSLQTQRARQALQAVLDGAVPRCILIYGIGAAPLLNHLMQYIRTEFPQLTAIDASERQYHYGAISVTKNTKK